MCFLPKSRHTRNRMLSADISRKVFGRITGNEVDSSKKEREDTIMFKGLFGKKEKNNKLYAPLKGEAVLLENIEDPMFAQKILGDGIAIEPSEGKVYSPADGTVSMIADTRHAIGINTADGLELLIHIGMDTVALNGEGYTPKVEAGASVKKGDLLMEFDMDFITGKGYSCVTPVIITNMDDIKSLTPHPGQAVPGETVVVDYEK